MLFDRVQSRLLILRWVVDPTIEDLRLDVEAYRLHSGGKFGSLPVLGDPEDPFVGHRNMFYFHQHHLRVNEVRTFQKDAQYLFLESSTGILCDGG